MFELQQWNDAAYGDDLAECSVLYDYPIEF